MSQTLSLKLMHKPQTKLQTYKHLLFFRVTTLQLFLKNKIDVDWSQGISVNNEFQNVWSTTRVLKIEATYLDVNETVSLSWDGVSR